MLGAFSSCRNNNSKNITSDRHLHLNHEEEGKDGDDAFEKGGDEKVVKRPGGGGIRNSSQV